MKSIMKSHPKVLILIISVLVLYLLLLIPTETSPSIPRGNKKPFVWNRDSVWKNLEAEFWEVRLHGCDSIKFTIDSLIKNSEFLLDEISEDTLSPSNEKFAFLENNIFNMAPLVPDLLLNTFLIT